MKLFRFLQVSDSHWWGSVITCLVNNALLSRECRVNDFFCCNATFKLSLHFPTVINSNFWCATRILRQAEFQICITLPHQWASETCRNRNSFIPTFSGHLSPNPSPRSGSWEPDYIWHGCKFEPFVFLAFVNSIFHWNICHSSSFLLMSSKALPKMIINNNSSIR